MVYQYSWRDDKIKYSVSPQVVGKEFEKIEKREGGLTNKAVLDSARPVKSPLHNVFEWDDQKAAEQYRLTQASRLINNLMVKVEAPDMDAPKIVRAFVNVSEKKVGEYINITSALTDEEARAKVLQDAINELESFKRKYSNLSELARVFEAITAVSNAT